MAGHERIAVGHPLDFGLHVTYIEEWFGLRGHGE